jgi:hypothetical protein
VSETVGSGAAKPRPRPEVGAVKTSLKKYQVCGKCGYLIDSTNLCSYGCEDDGEPHERVITAVYECTEKFLGDEP